MKWRKIIGWTLAGLAALLVCAVLGAYLFLKSRAFNQFALRKIAEAAQQATGGATSIRGLDFSLSTLTAHFYDVTVHGTEPSASTPLLHIDKLTVGVKVISVLHRKVDLNELKIERPVVYLSVDREGKNNLPTPPTSQTSSNTSVFDLGVRHAQLIGGTVNYEDRTIPLDVNLYNLVTEIHFDPLSTRYTGFISYDGGELRYGEYAALPHSFQANFEAAPARLLIKSAVAKIGTSVASLKASLTNYADPSITADYELHIEAGDLSSLAPEYRPAGNISAAGTIRYHGVPNQAMLRNLNVEGKIDSEAIAASTPSARVGIQKLRGTFQLTDGTLVADDIGFESFGGSIAAKLKIQNLDTTPSGSLRASLHAISLQAMQRSLSHPVKQLVLLGHVTGTADASWRGNIANVQLRSDLVLRAEAKSTSSASAGLVPVDGVIHAAYDGRQSSLILRRSELHLPSASITADGEISRHSSLQIQVAATDLHQLETLAASFGSSGSQLPPVSGTATVNAAIRGSLTRPQLSADIAAENVAVEGSTWRKVQASVQANPSQLTLKNGSLVSAHRGRASFNAAVTLHDWHYLPANDVRANLSVEQISIEELQRIAKVKYPVSGDLTANIAVSGSEVNPQGSGKIQVANARAYDEPVQTLAAQFHTDRDAIISSLHVELPAGSASADLSFTPKTKAYSIRLDAPSVVLQKLHTVQAKNLGLSGTLSASANGRGTLDNPQMNASIQVPQLNLRDKSISNIRAELLVADQKADVTLGSTLVNSSVRGRVHVNLTGDYDSDASIETTAIPLDVLLATYLTSVPYGFKGQTEVHASLKGPLKNTGKLEAHITIPVLEASYQSLQVGIASPVHADLANSVITLQPAEFRGTDTSLRVQGSMPIAGNSKPSLSAQGSVDMGILKIFSPDTQSSGVVTLDVRASGTAQDPNANGQVKLQDVALLASGAPLGVERLNGTLDIGKESIQISKLTGQVGGGNISAGGSIVYRPSLQFNLALQSKSVRLRYPDGLRTILDGNLALSGNKDASTLSGRVLIDALSFTSDFDLANFADQFSGDNAVPAQPGFADTINLAISVQSKDNLSASSSQISVEGGVNVHVGGTAANPVVTGRTDLTAGELFYRNVRYQLQRGIITFDDPNQTSPVLNVSVSTIVEQYNLTLNLRGPFDKLTTSYVSDPPLPTADIINLIARGQTTEESAASSQSTDSMIASQAASQFSGSLQKLAGISSLQIDPLIGGNNANPSARIAIQQRVTKNFLFTFSTDVSQPGSEIVQGEYRINKRWSVSATRDQVGGVAVDGRLHTRF